MKLKTVKEEAGTDLKRRLISGIENPDNYNKPIPYL